MTRFMKACCVFTQTFDGEVEAAQSVSGKRISSTLEHNRTWLVHLHDFSHDLKKHGATSTLSLKNQTVNMWTSHHLNTGTYRLEDGFIRLIVDTVSKRIVHSVVLPLSSSDVLHTEDGSLSYCTRKIYPKFRRNIKMNRLTLRSPVPGKYSPYLWKETVITLSVV